VQPISLDYASGLIFSKDGKILMGEKRPSKLAVYPDCWHIPGGGVDEGETLQQALVRELREETGIDASSCEIKLVDDQGRGESTRNRNGKEVRIAMRFFVFKVKIAANAADIALSANDDLINLRWFAPDELRSVKITPPSATLFKRLGYL